MPDLYRAIGLPGIYRAGLAPYPRATIAWRARDLENWLYGADNMQALTGQYVTSHRAATGTASDSYGVSLTVNNDRSRWHISSGLVTYRCGTSDYLNVGAGTAGVAVDFYYRPQAYSGVLDFIEQGPTASSGAFYIGNSGQTGARLAIDVSGGAYRIFHHNGTSSVTATMATAPTAGQRCQLRWWLYSDGKVQIWQSINGAAETTPGASATLALATDWATTTLVSINALGTGSNGARDWIGLAMMRGNQTQAALLQPLSY
jgi:hypothetical protein